MPNVLQEFLECRPLQAAAREAAVVILVSQTDPTLMGLALDIGTRGFPLRIKGAALTREFLVRQTGGYEALREEIDELASELG